MIGLQEKIYIAWKNREPPSPATKTLGITIKRRGKWHARLEMHVDETLHNLSGTMHGGVMGDIADAAMGIALATTLKPGADCTTIEMKMSFLRPHLTATLRSAGQL